MLRQTLKQTEKELISLQDEIKFINEYIELDKMRENIKYDFNLIVDSNINLESKIPTFIIQPLIENSIKHAFKFNRENNQIMVEFRKENKYLIVKVIDNGIGYLNNLNLKRNKTEKKYKPEGIETIKKRLKLHNKVKVDESISIGTFKAQDSSRFGTFIRLKIKLL